MSLEHLIQVLTAIDATYVFEYPYQSYHLTSIDATGFQCQVRYPRDAEGPRRRLHSPRLAILAVQG